MFGTGLVRFAVVLGILLARISTFSWDFPFGRPGCGTVIHPRPSACGQIFSSHILPDLETVSSNRRDFFKTAGSAAAGTFVMGRDAVDAAARSLQAAPVTRRHVSP